MPFATCPQCDERIRFADMPDVGDIIHCRTCDARLEVVAVNPIELDWPFDLDDEEDSEDDEAEFAVYPDEEDDDEDDEDDDYEEDDDLDY